MLMSTLCVSVNENKPDKKFMAMFIGFMDGDGYFDIGEQKQYNKTSKALVRSTIRMRLASNVHVRDRSLLEYVLFFFFFRSFRSFLNPNYIILGLRN